MARTAVIAGTATAVSGNVARRQQGRANAAAAEAQSEADMIAMQAQMALLQQQQAAAAAAPVAAAGDDITAQLVKLGELKAAGVLSDEEFAAAKAKLLGA
jgi:hypothetical protein